MCVPIDCDVSDNVYDSGTFLSTKAADLVAWRSTATNNTKG
jgi:hypothetical protein